LENLPDLLPDLVFTGIRVTGEKNRLTLGDFIVSCNLMTIAKKTILILTIAVFGLKACRHKLTSEILITKPDGSK
jgi:hypothetical protein